MTSDGVDDGVPEWVGDVGLPLAWPILVLATLTLFWALAVVCEERFVPALQVLCDRGKIPDDVAGATLMAAGASSPEVFASLISLFITQSALGVGTVIGSEIFNHLIICAGSVLAARGGVLVLEKRIVLRECSFYLVSCLLLLYVLTHETAQSGNSRVVVVRAWAPAAMLATYAVYVLVCVFFNDLTAKFTRRAHEKLDTEPSENFCGPNDAADGEAETGYASVASTAEQGFVPPRPDLGRYRSLSVRALKRLEGLETEIAGIVGIPDSLEALDFIEREPLACWLFKENTFYHSSRTTSSKSWELRWIEFDDEAHVSTRHARGAETAERYTIVGGRVSDARRLLVQLDVRRMPAVSAQASPLRPLQGGSPLVPLQGGDTYRVHFLAPSAGVCRAVEVYLDAMEIPPQAPATEIVKELLDDDAEASLVAWPEGARACGVGGLVHVLLLPLKALLHWTIVDVRLSGDGATVFAALRAAFASVAWLAVVSLGMCSCCEAIGALCGLSDAVVGISLSAVGTSLPNLVSSMLVAQKGLGNMAVSNALGSNTFNVLVGLGFPWALYVARHGTYEALPAEDVVTPVCVLIAALAAFVLLLFCTGFKLHKRHAAAFLGLYVAFLVVAVAGYMCSRSNGDFSLLEAVDLNLVLIAFFAAATLALLMFDVEDDGLSSAAAGACDVDDDLVSMDDSEQAEDDEDSQDDDFADCFESAQSYVPAHRPKGAPVADGRPARAASDNSRRPGAAWPDDGDAQDVRAAAAAARRERDLDALFDRSASRRRAVSSTSSSWARDEDDVVPGARVSAAPRAAHAPVTYRAEYRLSPAVCAAVCAAAGRDDCGEMTLDVGQDELVAALEAARSILMLELEAAKKQREKFERERERERRTFTDDAPAPAIERAAAAPAPAPTRSKAARRAPRRPAAPEPPPAAPPAAEAPSSRAAAADARVPDAAAPPGPARDTTRQEAASSKEDKGDASAPASDDAAAFAAAEAAQASAAQLKRQRQKERRLEAEQASRLCRDEAKRTAAAKRSVANAAARERAKDLVEAEAVTRAAAEEQRRRETASAWKQTQREESDQIARAVASAEEARRQSARAFDTAAAAAKLKVVSQRSARKAKMAEARPAPKVSHDESWAQPDYGYAPDADPPRTRQHVAARHDYFEYRAEEGYRTNRADEDYRQNEGFAGNDLRTAAMNSLADLANAPAPRHEHAHGYSQQQRHCGYAPFAGERFESDGFSDVFAAEPFADDSSFSAPQPYVPPQQYAGFGDTAWSPHAQQSAGFPGQAAPFAGQGPQFSGQAARPRWQGAYESPYGASLLQAGLDDTLRRSLVDADGDALQRAADAIFDRASSPQGGGESAPDDDASRSTMRATAKEFTLHHGQHAPPPGLSRGQDRFANDSRFAGDRYEDQRY